MPTKTISREEPRGSSSSPSLTAKLIAAPVNRRLTRRTSPAFMPKACRCTHSSRIVFLRPTVLGWVVRGVPPDLGTSGEIVTGSASKYCRPRNPSELSWHGNYSGCEETEFRSRVLPLVLLSWPSRKTVEEKMGRIYKKLVIGPESLSQTLYCLLVGGQETEWARVGAWSCLQYFRRYWATNVQEESTKTGPETFRQLKCRSWYWC